MSSTNGDGHGEKDDYVNGGIKPLAASDPARIGPYLLLGRLGAGGMGRVFLARSDSGRTVAVKVVHEEHVSDEQFRARFRREIDAARRVGERYTAPVIDAGPGDEPPWVATGYVPGLSLEQIVRRYGPLPAASLYALAEGLLKALKDIHGAGIVHRDLKPSNVMLTVDGTKVIDFGIARALETSVESLLTSTGMAVGSPGFMSPEQVRGQSAGVESDVFTLGCVLTYAATGQLPFGQGASNQHAVMFQIVEGEPDLSGVEDEALRAFITRCLAKDIAQRPSVEALLADPERPRPSSARGAWLPAGVVARIAQQSARLLDAEAKPLREEPVDRATIGLRPGTTLPEGMAGDGLAGDGTVTAREPEEKPRRRRRLVVLPVIAVLTVGGGTVAVLQPFASDGGSEARAKTPSSSASVHASAGASAGPGVSATPLASNSPAPASSSPSTAASDPAKGDPQGQDGKGGAAIGGAGGQNAQNNGGGSAPGTGDGGANAAAGGSTKGAGGGAAGGSGSGSGGRTGSGGSSGSSGSSGSTAGSPPPAMTAYSLTYANSCVGACSMPIAASWPAVSGATRYDIHYTNKGSNFTKKNVDTVLSTGGLDYTINGPYSGDEICVTVRAANKYGASAWAKTTCDTVPY
ncbi:serine/threonine-protein kinase [Streptomyces sp. NBC_00083]|uniref:serine/threonine-protein kinase n=1 Tax=Streptomyces sp. NBC_00083 TaxID=2975647 RepID=UPI00224EE0CA|nr:serine/threonine-protein kinase [Streptomyces sp. NBC_00083]MCX5386379.1 serine/threonine protein kinase [Streptomyces sp. NBC_00083]